MDNLTIRRPEGFEGQRLYRVPPPVIVRMSQRPHTRDFLVTDLGYFPESAGHRVNRPNGTSSHILIFVEEGSGWVRLAGRTFAANSGQVILLPAKQVHAYGSDPVHPWKIYWFHFQGNGAANLLKWTPFSRAQPVATCPAADSLRRHFRAILATVERGYSEHCILELSRALINVLSLLHTRSRGSAQSPQAARIEKSMEAMRERLDQPQPLLHYAKQCGLSVSRYSEVFREHCGVSPMTYFTELRVQRACELLDTTDGSVGEIATRLGFEDALYFSRLFRKHTGMTASAYRKRGAG
jgi:AraC family transcriptional regulator of arabinose operon